MITDSGDDVVQCVPTKKGLQILYKGYTYVFRSRLHCGVEQWCCSFRQKTENSKPDWVSIYYLKINNDQMKCNICEATLNADEKSKKLLEHIISSHREVYELHKENPEATVGFQIEFLNYDMKDDGDAKIEPIIIGEVCETTTEEIVKCIPEMPTINPRVVVASKKKGKRRENETRRKSWVWKYFERVSSIIYRCTACGAVLSIKGCNTNNMNRHIKSIHPNIYQQELAEKKLVELDSIEALDATDKSEISYTDIENHESKSQKQLHRRSWIWMYFDRISSTLAQCKICHRKICHGGNATGNMNRHLKIIHNKTGSEEDHSWIWKVFDKTEEGVFSCKICEFRCLKFVDADMNISCILQHLKLDHGVISGNQIITTTGSEDED